MTLWQNSNEEISMKIYRAEPRNSEHPELVGPNLKTLKAKANAFAGGEDAFLWEEEDFSLTEEGLRAAISWGSMWRSNVWEWVN